MNKLLQSFTLMMVLTFFIPCIAKEKKKKRILQDLYQLGKVVAGASILYLTYQEAIFENNIKLSSTEENDYAACSIPSHNGNGKNFLKEQIIKLPTYFNYRMDPTLESLIRKKTPNISIATSISFITGLGLIVSGVKELLN